MVSTCHLTVPPTVWLLSSIALEGGHGATTFSIGAFIRGNNLLGPLCCALGTDAWIYAVMLKKPCGTRSVDLGPIDL